MSAQSQAKDEALAQRLAEHQIALEEAARKAEAEVAVIRVADLKVFAIMEKNLGIGPLLNEHPEKGLFVESLANRVPRVSEAAKGWFDSAAEAEFTQSVCYVEGFLRCRYQSRHCRSLLLYWMAH